MKSKLGKLRVSTLALGLLLLSVTSLGFTRTTNANPGIFKITLMVPNSNPARQSWSLVVQSELQALGIDANRVIFDFPTIINKAIQPDPSFVGKDYDHGGWDTLFIGNALAIDPDPAILYNSTNAAPTGNNYNLWNNTLADRLGTQIDQTVDRNARIDLVKQWQALAQDEAPSATILYTKETVAFDTKMPNGGNVFKIYHFPYWPPIEQLSSNPPDSTIILDQTGAAPQNLIPELSSSYYDTTISGVIFAAMAQRNDTIFKSMLPQLASGTVQSPGWTVSSDGKTWTVSLRSGVNWHDAATCTPQPACGLVTADDVKFTFDSIMNDTLAAPVESFYKSIIGGPNNVVVVDPTTVRFILPNVYAYFVENILTTAILPQHILGSIPYNSTTGPNWRTSSFNTGQGGPGPVGFGPYMWDHLTGGTGGISYLIRNDNYLDFPVNGKSALITRGAFGIKNYDVKTIVGSDQAITDITTGGADVLDSQYHLETQQNFLSTWGSSNYATYNAYGIQEMAFNMRHSILGTGVDTPLGKSDPSKAALAAKYVRQAISHAIPRQLIIDQLLFGAGSPGITSAVTPAMDGFNTALTPHSFNLTESRRLLTLAGYFPPAPAAPASFWDTYGVYLVGALVVAVVAVSALYVMRTRRKPMSPTMQPSMSASPPPPS